MNLFAMKVTYPVDDVTIQELNNLLQRAQQQDALLYDGIMNKDSWASADIKGFLVLAYDDEQDLLVGAINATDNLGINAYEWSLVMEPNYRGIGIEEVLIEGLKHGLEERQATGEMASVHPQLELAELLQKSGYLYSSSKIQMQALPELAEITDIEVQSYEEEHLPILQKLMADGFGDLPEETTEFTQLIKNDVGAEIWLVYKNEEIVATMTTAVEGRSLWITAFTTLESRRHEGIALNLLQWVKHYATENEISSILLEVETDNPAALALYTKSGFINKEQIDYYIVH